MEKALASKMLRVKRLALLFQVWWIEIIRMRLFKGGSLSPFAVGRERRVGPRLPMSRTCSIIRHSSGASLGGLGCLMWMLCAAQQLSLLRRFSVWLSVLR